MRNRQELVTLSDSHVRASRRRSFRRAALAACLALAGPALAQAPAASLAVTPAYKRSTTPVDERVADLLGRMTLEEKVGQLRGASRNEATKPGTHARQVADAVNAAQRAALKQSRLGIPLLFHEDAQSGTAFPQALALAAAWDPPLVAEVNAAIASEARSRGARMLLGPSLDIGRDPRRGRIEHTFGEDPYLVGELAVAALDGLQGPRSTGLPPGKVLAAIRHAAGPSIPAANAEAGPAPVAERELRQSYFPPFEEALRRATPAAIVPSRNDIGGIPTHANPWLLQDVIRNEWKFSGAVVADPGAIAELAALYGVAADRGEAARLALVSGVDAGLSGDDPIAEAVRAGAVPQARVDAAAARVLALKFRAGLFEQPYADAANAAATSSMRTARAKALSLRAAQRSIVLLQNDGALPLALPAGGRARMKIAVVEVGVPLVTLADGLRAKAGARADIQLAVNKAKALEIARGADRVLVVMGTATPEAETLLAELKPLGKPLVVVLAGERPSVSVAVAAHANALVGAWALGDQGSRALADVLVGDVNPGGKLPVTLARVPGQWPLFYNAQPSARRGYLFESSDPLFPFGWGLSYTTFEVGAPRLSSATASVDGGVTVFVDVRNSGTRSGDETVQLYVRDKVGSVARPVKQLKGFQRVTLAAGESRTLTFTLPARAFEMWDTGMRRTVEPGEFEVMTGNQSAKLQSATLTVAGAPR